MNGHTGSIWKSRVKLRKAKDDNDTRTGVFYDILRSIRSSGVFSSFETRGLPKQVRNYKPGDDDGYDAIFDLVIPFGRSTEPQTVTKQQSTPPRSPAVTKAQLGNTAEASLVSSAIDSPVELPTYTQVAEVATVPVRETQEEELPGAAVELPTGIEDAQLERYRTASVRFPPGHIHELPASESPDILLSNFSTSSLHRGTQTAIHHPSSITQGSFTLPIQQPACLGHHALGSEDKSQHEVASDRRENNDAMLTEKGFERFLSGSLSSAAYPTEGASNETLSTITAARPPRQYIHDMSSRLSIAVLESSRSSTLTSIRSPTVILQNEYERWIFPGVSIAQVLSKLPSDISSQNFFIKGISNPNGASPKSSTASTMSSPNLSVRSASAKQANKRRNEVNMNDDRRKLRRNLLQQIKSKPRATPLRYGCPFTKYNPERYREVHNSCTATPGIEWKYMIEHLTRVHSSRAKCIHCKKPWMSPDFEAELLSHASVCPEKSRIASLPECMTAAQERMYKVFDVEQGHSDKKWISLYMRLFPDPWPIPFPRYDYYIATHLIHTPSGSTPANPVTAMDNNVASEDTSDDGDLQLPSQTWSMYTLNGVDDETHSSVPAPVLNDAYSGFFSHSVVAPSATETLEMSGLNSVNPEPIASCNYSSIDSSIPFVGYGAGYNAPPPIVNNYPQFNIGDFLVYPDDFESYLANDGNELLDIWIGQNSNITY